MSILIYIDHSDGKIKKQSLEVLTYGADLARALGCDANGLILGTVQDDLSAFGKYGIQKVFQVSEGSLNQPDLSRSAKLIAEVAGSKGATALVFSHNITGKALAPLTAARLKAGLVAGAVSLPDISNGFVVRKTVFSGKAFAQVSIKTPIRVIAVTPNAYTPKSGEGMATVEQVAATLPAPSVTVTHTEKITGTIPLGEAELVVSGGRGLKGPENWGMVEELAGLIGAATACSRAVADAHWRPHHEHVGQTGLAIAPNLYIAIGISGAIQHLAGVNRSKVIVVVNKDPEAPFFKAADYGIVGDAFEVMPKIIEAVKKLKSA